VARVPYVSRESLPPDQQQYFDQIAGKRGHVAPPFAALLNSPAAAARVAAVGEQLRYVSPSISPDMREIVTLTVTRELRCQYIWTHHVFSAREAGVREEVINVIRDGAAVTSLKPHESALVLFTRELLKNNRVSDATFTSVQAPLGRQATVDLVLIIGYYGLMCHVANALDIELEEDVAPLLPDAPR